MKAFLAMILVVTSLTALAQRRDDRHDDNRNSGRIVLRDGRSTVRISVGNDRDTQNIRIRNLEEAVRDLQEQVYDLRDSQPQTRMVTMTVCSMVTTFNGTFIGKATSKVEAEAITRQKCSANGREAFCASNRVNCEQIQEEVQL